MRRFLSLSIALAALVAVTGPAWAQEHGTLTPEQLQWGPLDPAHPEGAQVAVLAGDPSAAGPFVMRAKFPAGSMVASHSHSNTEYITVLSGRMQIAFGENPDQAQATELGAGDHHTVWFPEETVLDISSTGPFDINYD